ncbi:MAG TPA: low temperature requirement protein A [Pseudonocardiaceae bacterium]|jgi:low temperature requirement protein LtrA|nr:low temperature requirement protein A [Pseudonocardiaceae bacterium]
MSEASAGTTSDSEQQARAAHEERHASWLELFFDLIVAAGVAQIADRLREAPTPANTLACVAMFYAVWSVWTAFCAYANVAGERTRTRALLLAMLGMGVMAAAIPGTMPELLPHDDTFATGRTQAFIVAFVLCRGLAGSATRRAGKVIAFWPAAQGLMIAPWVVSLAVGETARYWLWGAGVVLDVALSIRAASDPESAEKLTQHMLRQQAAEDRHIVRRLISHYRPIQRPDITIAEVERGHLEERLSLFVIIVLGEALAQLVAAATRVSWTRVADIGLIVGFALLVGIWQLTVRYGFGPVPGSADAPMRPWVSLPTHFAVVAGIAATAAGLGSLALELTATAQTGARWYLCGGLIVYFLAGALSGIGRSVPRAWTVGWTVPCVAAAVVLGLVGGALPGWLLTVLAAVVVAWQVSYEPLRNRLARRPEALAR